MRIMIGNTTHFNVDRTERPANTVTGAIQLASAKTGVDFDYLVKQARVESSMNPNAKARTSSATGLYQFIEQTWLRMVKNHGAEHGYANMPTRSARTAMANISYPTARCATRSSICARMRRRRR